MPKSERPVSGLVNLLIDAAHKKHENRNVPHPATPAYTLFAQRLPTCSGAGTTAGHSGASGSGSGGSRSSSGGKPRTSGTGTGTGAAPPINLDACRRSPGNTGFAAHSATTVYAWEERSPRRSGGGSPRGNGGGAAATASPSPLGTGMGSRGPSPLGRTAPAAIMTAPAAGRRALHDVLMEEDRAQRGSLLGAAPQMRMLGAEAEAAPTPSLTNLFRYLQVVCLYDSNFQAANSKGQHGVPLRATAKRQGIGPISYLYRWYCKRGTQFRSAVTAVDVPDAPARPSTEEPWRAVDTAAAASSTSASASGRSNSSSSSSTAQQRHNTGGGAAAVASASCAAVVAEMPAWLRKATTQRAHSGPGIFHDSADGGGGAAAAVARSSFDGYEKVPTTSGRRMNYTADPLMSLSELVDMLEDLEVIPGCCCWWGGGEVVGVGGEVVPHMASRTDVAKIFNAARQAFASATATPTATNAAGHSADSATAATAVAAAAARTTPPRPPHPPHPAAAAAAGGRGQQISVPAIKLLQQQQQRPASAVVHYATGNNNRNNTATQANALDPWASGFNTLSGISSIMDMAMAAAAAAAATSGPNVPRPTSAPRVLLSRPGGGGGGGTAAAAAATAGATTGGAANVIPRTQPHPDDIRFPVFKDILVRLAVAIACNEPLTPAGGVAASAAAAKPAAAAAVGATFPGTASIGSLASRGLNPLPSSSCNGGAAAVAADAASSPNTFGLPYGSGRTMSKEDATLAVRRLLERMQLYRSDVRILKHRLDELARLAKEHGIRVRDNRFRCVAVSVVDVAQDIPVAIGVTAPPPPARPGLPGRVLAPWSVLAATPAPSYLSAVVTEEDQEDPLYQPAWREFGAVALDLGVLQPGELRRCRLLLHCRGPYTLSVRIDTTNAPFCDVTHVGLHSIPPGLNFRVDMSIQIYDIGKVAGELRLIYNSTQDRREREVVVPVYGMVYPTASTDATVDINGRSWPRSTSERGVMAAKLARQRTPAAAAALAVPMVPPLRGPPSPSPSASSPSGSSCSTGYDNSNRCTGMALHKTHDAVRRPEGSAAAAAVPAAVAEDSCADSRSGGGWPGSHGSTGSGGDGETDARGTDGSGGVGGTSTAGVSTLPVDSCIAASAAAAGAADGGTVAQHPAIRQAKASGSGNGDGAVDDRPLTLLYSCIPCWEAPSCLLTLLLKGF
ncbi:hypothetical protein VOLCADRAFT_95622 [Volvox carteri f. nagariensis]|uniref:Uncharacterized protein n=1 Tax=Volvox carteri f. nagariensis TaxID=3068 RepID=D8U7T2_VOLCA|nr:uncharacterized protein VOLCADRAFT_95622 [Volvox carteri f. nagariensis]EFJ44199.1 hypothetical protein VOLCADRAFT_95622 [Volvox carteri f. nagariensis]|eukprot:XP_002954793.1 hypothetical protein VOLCADRAFT_95622 [Volvox carteri f. nagariensis]